MADKEFYKTSEYMIFFVLAPVEIKIIRFTSMEMYNSWL
jgi:hypothetical protein